MPRFQIQKLSLDDLNNLKIRFKEYSFIRKPVWSKILLQIIISIPLVLLIPITRTARGYDAPATSKEVYLIWVEYETVVIIGIAIFFILSYIRFLLDIYSGYKFQIKYKITSVSISHDQEKGNYLILNKWIKWQIRENHSELDISQVGKYLTVHRTISCRLLGVSVV